MRNRIILTFAAILGFASVAFAQDFQTKTIRHDGIEREYRLFVPDSIAPERSLVKDLNLNKLNCSLRFTEMLTRLLAGTTTGQHRRMGRIHCRPDCR